MDKGTRSGGDGMSKSALYAFALLALALMFAAGPARAAGGAGDERMTATVVEFSVRGDLNEQAGAIIADLMMSAIANTGRFTLKDRLSLAAAARIAKAQELGSTGLLDPKTAAELGRLYGVDAVVTGGVYKLGDLITVTARLIDTKTASLLRSGQIQGKDIDAIQVKVNELAAMITAPPEPSPTYALTVKTDPVDASVRLPNAATPYQPGVRLQPGDYDVEVTQPGYVARKESVRIGDRDVTVTVVLEKAKFGLTVRPEPADAQIRLLDSSITYRPGVALAPGNYEIEVMREGYLSRKFPVRIVDGEVTVPVTLEKAPPLRQEQYRLTVLADPPQSSVRLLNSKTPYQPGVQLPPGDYQLEITSTGYEPARLSVRIANSDLMMPINLKKIEQPATYRLTVQPNPPTAKVRLLNIGTAYEPGVRLAPGNYTVEINQAGYESARVSVRIADGDVTVPVTLVKLPEPAPPTLYRLTVRADPPTARVRLVGGRAAYKPGIQLAPGSYAVEISQPGYESKQVSVRIADGDVTVPVTLAKLPEPTQYHLSVQPDPPDSRVRLRGTKTVYRPGVLLLPGGYTVEVSRSGYETKQISVRIVDGDVTVPVALTKRVEPLQYRLTVRTTPANARVRLVNSPFTYRPGVSLPPGGYVVEVTGNGYESKRLTVQIVDGDVTEPVELEKSASATPSAPSLPSATRAGEWRIGAVRLDSSLNDTDRSEVLRMLNGYSGRVVTRDTLLDGAMRVYQSTGITLSFVVRPSAAGTADLHARVSRQVRRTYESNIPIMTRSQLENSGFGVSVE